MVGIYFEVKHQIIEASYPGPINIFSEKKKPIRIIVNNVSRGAAGKHFYRFDKIFVYLVVLNKYFYIVSMFDKCVC